MILRILCGVAGLVLLSSCATLSEEECLTGNWREIGQRDGQAGRTADFLANHAKACEKAGVVPDRAAWERGRQAGLPAYCTVSRLYREGREGRGLSPVCPASQLPALEAANAKGKRYRAITNEISEIRRDISDIESEIVKSDDPGRRSALLARISMLNARISLKQAQRMTYAAP